MMRRLREPDNGLTHLAGAFLAVIALIILTDLALHVGSPRHIVAFAIFGVSLVGLYTASGLYHSLHLGPVGLDRLLRLDCVMVYVLIAGTYTPFCLVAFQGVWRWGLLALIWALGRTPGHPRLRRDGAAARYPLGPCGWDRVHGRRGDLRAGTSPTAPGCLRAARPLACAGDRRECLPRLGGRPLPHHTHLSAARRHHRSASRGPQTV
jgi:hypothetical protein